VRLFFTLPLMNKSTGKLQEIGCLLMAAPLQAPLAVDAAFLSKDADGGMTLAGIQGLIFETFHNRGNPESVQPR